MATGKMDEDAVLTALLTALEDLHNIQTEMNTCIKQVREFLFYFLERLMQVRETRKSGTEQSIHHVQPWLWAKCTCPCVYQGFLNMAKARRSLGRNSVSVHDTREEYSAEVTIDMSVPSHSISRGPVLLYSWNDMSLSVGVFVILGLCRPYEYWISYCSDTEMHRGRTMLLNQMSVPAIVLHIPYCVGLCSLHVFFKLQYYRGILIEWCSAILTSI